MPSRWGFIAIMLALTWATCDSFKAEEAQSKGATEVVTLAELQQRHLSASASPWSFQYTSPAWMYSGMNFQPRYPDYSHRDQHSTVYMNEAPSYGHYSPVSNQNELYGSSFMAAAHNSRLPHLKKPPRMLPAVYSDNPYEMHASYKPSYSQQFMAPQVFTPQSQMVTEQKPPSSGLEISTSSSSSPAEPSFGLPSVFEWPQTVDSGSGGTGAGWWRRPYGFQSVSPCLRWCIQKCNYNGFSTNQCSSSCRASCNNDGFVVTNGGGGAIRPRCYPGNYCGRPGPSSNWQFGTLPLFNTPNMYSNSMVSGDSLAVNMADPAVLSQNSHTTNVESSKEFGKQ